MKVSTVHTAHMYRMYEGTNRFAIEIAVDDYNDIFNEWDPAPFSRRDLDPELQIFLEECSRDISLQHPLAIVFYMPKDEHNMEDENACIAGIRNYFAFKIHVFEKKRNEVMVGVLRNLSIGVAILCIAIVFEAQFSERVFLQVFREGLFIGGWVFIWEALATIGFKNRALKHTMKEYVRFFDAPVVFKNEPLPKPE